jgi:hypothetical protein
LPQKRHLENKNSIILSSIMKNYMWWPQIPTFLPQVINNNTHINSKIPIIIDSHECRNPNYRNPSIGLATKAKACKGVGQERSLGVTSHALGSVRECEGMNPHIPKWIPTLGVGILMGFWIFKEWLQGSKPIGLKNSLNN